MARSLGLVESMIGVSVRSGVSLHFRQYFLQQETGKPVIEAVEFETAIKARIIRRAGRSDRSRKKHRCRW